MRGKVSVGRLEIISVGITPAYAGKSPPHTRYTHTQWDHPRLCGEKPVSLQLPHDSLRITPAYAGKSAEIESLQGKLEDHPRLCGEKRCTVSFNRLLMGSPPPMRGKVTNHAPRRCRKGITPAYAGKRQILLQVL